MKKRIYLISHLVLSKVKAFVSYSPAYIRIASFDERNNAELDQAKVTEKRYYEKRYANDLALGISSLSAFIAAVSEHEKIPFIARNFALCAINDFCCFTKNEYCQNTGNACRFFDASIKYPEYYSKLITDLTSAVDFSIYNDVINYSSKRRIGELIPMLLSAFGAKSTTPTIPESEKNNIKFGFLEPTTSISVVDSDNIVNENQLQQKIVVVSNLNNMNEQQTTSTVQQTVDVPSCNSCECSSPVNDCNTNSYCGKCNQCASGGCEKTEKTEPQIVLSIDPTNSRLMNENRLKLNKSIRKNQNLKGKVYKFTIPSYMSFR